MDAIAILDVGKTNVKVTLVADGGIIEQRRRHNEPHPAPPYLHLANDRIWDWALDQLTALSRQFTITDIVPVAHGASVAAIDGGGLVLPMLDYEQDISDFDAEYEQLARDFAETACPRLPCGHNTGRQLFWLQRKFSEAFARTKAIVGYSQYWAFLLSGVAASELTALGCHTDLWRPRVADYSRLVDTTGWRRLMPPLRKASDVLGPIRPEIAARTGLSPQCRVRCGIHDSNATFLRWRSLLQEPFTVASTGTWIILLAAGGNLPAAGEHLDCLGNVDALGNLVASARFLGGRELERIAGEHRAVGGSAEDKLTRLLAVPCYALPAFSDQGGPFAGRKGRIVDEHGNDAAASDPSTLGAVYCALMTDLMLDVLTARGPIILDGPFATNNVYIAALAALRPESPVLPSAETQGTSLGAALLADPNWPASLPVAALRPAVDITAYRTRWRMLSGADRVRAEVGL
ncbi:FGGY-family carbohydrate kinase [Dongia deserti]|uniref:FGGY-family carbohydrate kinase n=1 Tax=Dongia deserti TaxID=2268030 RepID=UPI0013C443D4|nr:FGGY family carbohydrate kinase [Dongia deserti]